MLPEVIDPAPKCPLTRRQIMVVRWIADGKTARDIAEIEGLSKPTVEGHVQRAMRVAGCSKNSALVAMALRKGWIS